MIRHGNHPYSKLGGNTILVLDFILVLYRPILSIYLCCLQFVVEETEQLIWDSFDKTASRKNLGFSTKWFKAFPVKNLNTGALCHPDLCVTGFSLIDSISDGFGWRKMSLFRRAEDTTIRFLQSSRTATAKREESGEKWLHVVTPWGARVHLSPCFI